MFLILFDKSCLENIKERLNNWIEYLFFKRYIFYRGTATSYYNISKEQNLNQKYIFIDLRKGISQKLLCRLL